MFQKHLSFYDKVRSNSLVIFLAKDPRESFVFAKCLAKEYEVHHF